MKYISILDLYQVVDVNIFHDKLWSMSLVNTPIGDYIPIYTNLIGLDNRCKNRVPAELLKVFAVTIQNNTLKPNPAAGALRGAVPSAIHIVAQNLGIPQKNTPESLPVYPPIAVQLADIQLHLALKIAPKNLWEFLEQLVKVVIREPQAPDVVQHSAYHLGARNLLLSLLGPVRRMEPPERLLQHLLGVLGGEIQ